MSDSTAVQRRRKLSFPELEVGGFTRLDGSVDFYNRVNALVTADSTVLDFGAGRGEWLEYAVDYRRELRHLRGRVHAVIGADLDPVVAENPACDQHVVMPDAVTVPVADASVDVVVADHDFKHVAEPAAVAHELHRVLRDGGRLCVRTPNRFGYIGVGINSCRTGHTLACSSECSRSARQKRRSRRRTCSTPGDSWSGTSRQTASISSRNCVNAEPAYFGGSRVSWAVVRFVSRFCELLGANGSVPASVRQPDADPSGAGEGDAGRKALQCC